MAEIQISSLADSIREARQRVEQELRAQAERFEKLSQELMDVRQLHEQTEQEAARQWEEVARAAEQAVAKAAEEAAAQATEVADARAAEQAARAAEDAAKAVEQAAAKAAEEAAAKAISPEAVLEGVLSAVRNLVTATAPDQVLEALTQEASQLGVRAAIFDVRGKAAWGASAHGFGPALTEKILHGLIVPLNQDSPFKQVCDIGGHVDATAASLKKNRNVLDKLKPGPKAPILLLPIRSGGTVSAIFYSDPGASDGPLPVNALKILAEFGGAQIDRLIALSGGFAAEEAAEEAPEAPHVEEAEAPGHEVEALARAAEAVPEGGQDQIHPVEPPPPPTGQPAVDARAAVVEPPAPEPPPPVDVVVDAPLPPPPLIEPPIELAPPPAQSAPEPPVVQEAPPPAPPAAVAPPTPSVFDISQLSEADQKVHKDAKRFAKLLVSEIELYNKAKVADGRKNRDVYKRLKSDIDRSRQTFDKRFGKVLTKQVDYFHDELVKTLAANDPTVLGTEYPGPSA